MLSHPQRKGYEQLLRKLLRLPGGADGHGRMEGPAVVQLHTWSWWRATPQPGLFAFPEAEAQHTLFSHYYDLPSISMRAALYHLMRQGLPGFKVRAAAALHSRSRGAATAAVPWRLEKEQPLAMHPLTLTPPPPLHAQTEKVWDAGKVTPLGYTLPQCEGGGKRGMPKGPDCFAYFYGDRTHPNDGGHQILAELLAGLVMHAADEHWREQQQQRRQQQGAEATPVWVPRRPEDKQGQVLPPPMIPGNADVPTSLCAIQVRAVGG